MLQRILAAADIQRVAVGEEGTSAQLLDQVKHVLAEAVFVGGGMAGLVDAAVDAAAQMFYE